MIQIYIFQMRFVLRSVDKLKLYLNACQCAGKIFHQVYLYTIVYFQVIMILLFEKAEIIKIVM